MQSGGELILLQGAQMGAGEGAYGAYVMPDVFVCVCSCHIHWISVIVIRIYLRIYICVSFSA